MNARRTRRCPVPPGASVGETVLIGGCIASLHSAISLVPKLLFGNPRLRNSVSVRPPRVRVAASIRVSAEPKRSFEDHAFPNGSLGTRQRFDPPYDTGGGRLRCRRGVGVCG